MSDPGSAKSPVGRGDGSLKPGPHLLVHSKSWSDVKASTTLNTGEGPSQLGNNNNNSVANFGGVRRERIYLDGDQKMYPMPMGVGGSEFLFRGQSFDSRVKSRISLSGTKNEELKSPAMHIFNFLNKLRYEGKLSDAEAKDVEQLLSHLASMRNLWAARDLEVLDEHGHPLVDEDIKQFLLDTLANPAEQLPGGSLIKRPSSKSLYVDSSDGSAAAANASVTSSSSTEAFPPPDNANNNNNNNNDTDNINNNSNNSNNSTGSVVISRLFSEEEVSCLELSDDWTGYSAYDIDKATGGKCLSSLGIWLFRQYDFESLLDVQMDRVEAAFRKFETLYHDNPYHNRLHATDVLQCCHYMLSHCGMDVFFTPLEKMALLLAALIHDLDHPGTNNSFQVATHSELGLRYNDRSVLENHHVALAFTLLWGGKDQGKKNELDFLEFLGADDKKILRKLVVEMVLATDLAVNVEIVNHFRIEWEHGKFNSLIQGPPVEESDKSEEKILLLKMMIKCADISHVVRPCDYHVRWTYNVTQEFHEQGDRERDLGLPVAAFMDRHVGGLAKGQASFLQFVAKPMWTLLESFMSSDELLMQLERNFEYWSLEAKKEASTITPSTPSFSTQSSSSSLIQQQQPQQPSSSSSSSSVSKHSSSSPTLIPEAEPT